jgi:hypothetical protein
MKSYFQNQIGLGRFLARDHLAFKNLKTFKHQTQEDGTPEGTPESDSTTEDQKKDSALNNRREEH